MGNTNLQKHIYTNGAATIDRLAISKADGTLYGLTDSPSNNNLITIDTATGIQTIIGSVGSRLTSFGCAFDGTLYSIDNVNVGGVIENQILTIDPLTAELTTIATLPFWFTGHLAINDENKAFGRNTDIDDWIWEANLESGYLTCLGYFDYSSKFVAGAPDTWDYAPDGTLFALNNGRLTEVDLDNLTYSRIYEGYINIPGGDGNIIDFAVVPEPSTLLLLGLGAVMVRKKHK